MSKTQIQRPLVELDGDEMARIMWRAIKDELIMPSLGIDIKYFDLSIQNRDKTLDSVTQEAVQAIKTHKIAVKCATITPNAQRQKEFALKEIYQSPNATIRNAIQGTIFRKPVTFRNLQPMLKNWQKPITIARHGSGGVYEARETLVSGGSSITLICRNPDGTDSAIATQHIAEDGALMLIHNSARSITDFAESCFEHALGSGQNLFLSTKNTISKIYDGLFEQIFQQVFVQKFAQQFAAKRLTYEHRLIDDMVAYAMRSNGGFLWACKNYDGDVQSDFVAQGFGGLSIMRSFIVNSKKNYFLAEAAHGTVTRHFRAHQKGEKTSTNPIGSIFAWTQAIKRLGSVENNNNATNFAEQVEQACVHTVEEGIFPKDIASLLGSKQYATTFEFIAEVKKRLKAASMR